VRLTDDGLDAYLAAIANLLDRHGIELDTADRDLTIDQTATGHRRLDVRGFMPAGTQGRARVGIRETWVADGTGAFERAEYVYDLLDTGRGFRRAFHLHDRESFERRFDVVVHEHCERPIGTVDCERYEGSPIRDGFAGVMRILEVWTADPPDCADFRCLE